MKTARPYHFCLSARRLAVPLGLGLALGVSNGPAVGVAVGVALAGVFSLRRG